MRFPLNVFVRPWDDYLFFDTFVMSDANFIEAKNTILDEEGSSCIALVNLGNAPSDVDVEPRSVYLERNTTAHPAIGYF